MLARRWTIGRYSVACGSVGIAQACLDASARYAARPAAVRRARCRPPAHPRDADRHDRRACRAGAAPLPARRLAQRRRRPRTIGGDHVAKYFASTVAASAATDAVQIHGANGCSEDYPVAALPPRRQGAWRSSRGARRSSRSRSAFELQELWEIDVDDRQVTGPPPSTREEEAEAVDQVRGLGPRQHGLGRHPAGGPRVTLRPHVVEHPEDAGRAGHPALDRQPQRSRHGDGEAPGVRPRRVLPLSADQLELQVRLDRRRSPRTSTSASTRSPSSTTSRSSARRWPSRTARCSASTRRCLDDMLDRPEFNPRFITEDSRQRRRHVPGRHRAQPARRREFAGPTRSSSPP